MILAFEALKKILPELNEKVITPERIFEVFDIRGIEFHELDYGDTNGAYVVDNAKREYVILKKRLSQLLFHETLALEGTHAFIHEVSAKFLLRKHQMEAENFAVICMIPETELPRLVTAYKSSEPEIYSLLVKRIEILHLWNI